MPVPAPDDVEAGLRLAQRRQAAFRRLIHVDPDRALASAISARQRRSLPSAVAQRLEQPISGVGSVYVVGQIGDSRLAPIGRAVRVGGRTYRAHVAGEAPLRGMNGARIEGFAIGNDAVVTITPPRPREAQAAIPQNTATNAPAGASVASGAGAISPGNKRVLVIRAMFADQSVEPATALECADMMSGAGAFYVANSLGQVSFTTTVMPNCVVLPHSAQWYKDNDTSGFALAVLEDARAAAKAAGYNWDTDYDLEIVRYNGGPGADGQGNIGQRGCWIKVTSSGVAAHELGHNFGNYHANAWEPVPADNPVGPGYNAEYADIFDTMGNAAAGAHHFNVFEKNALGWTTAVQTVTSSGRYRIYAHDTGVSPGGGTLALKIDKDSQRRYWLEFRQNPGWAAQPWIWNGVGLRWGAWGVPSNSGSQLIDVTSASPYGKDDSPIVIGATFSDPLVPVHITPIQKNGTVPVESVDVIINFGNASGNRAPTIQLAASATTVAIDTPVTITATAADADGDALAYAWSLGDRSVGENAWQVVKSWSAPGNYRVRCTASDMKGGTASASVVIRVGTPSGGYLVAGRVTDATGQPLADVRVHNGLATTSANYRTALSDSDGYYVLTDVPAGSYTMQAMKSGYSLAPSGFVNPLAVSGDVSNVNFAAAQKTYAIRGKVVDGTVGVGGVIVTDGFRSEVTGPTGEYTIYGVPDGKYLMSARKTGYSFTSSGWLNPLTVNGADLSNKNFFHYQPPNCSVSGNIVGAPAGAKVRIATANGQYWTETTTTSTSYTLALPAGQWNLRATLAGASFTPVGWSNPLTVTGAATGKDFVADPVARYTVSGRITELGAGLAGASVSAGAGQPSSLTDATGTYCITGLGAGDYTITPAKDGATFVPVSRSVTIASADVSGVDFATTAANSPPWITVSASADPNPVPGTKTTLSVRADDDGGAELLWYSWAIVGTPPTAVTFSVNNAHLASATVATFTRAGVYTFRATACDAYGGSVSSDVTVTVLQTPTAIAVTPASPTILAGASQQFAAALQDQFGQSMPLQPAFAWSVSGGGVISSAGLFSSGGALGAFTVIASADGLSGSTTVKVAGAPGLGSGITRQWYNGISGQAVSDLTGSTLYPHLPTTAQILASAQSPADIGDTYGQRLRGYFIPPGDGVYTFFIASDDDSELYLSTSDSPGGRVKIASVTGSTSINQWDKFASQQSAAITLVGGQRYYIEALHKEANGGDHLEIGVDTPGGVQERPIPGHRLIPLPIVSITASTPVAREWAPAVPGVCTVSRAGAGTVGDLVVNYSVSGSASPGSDYAALAGSVTIPDGQASATILVAPMDDADEEGDETVIVRVLDGANYAVNAGASATVTILDDEIVATIVATDPQAREPDASAALQAADALDSACADAPVDEPSPAQAAGSLPDLGTFTVSISRAVGVDTVISYTVGGSATPGADYETLGGTAVILAGRTSATIDVVPLADALAEVPETVVVTLTTGAGYAVGTPSSATVVIGDPAPAAPALTATAIDGRSIRLDFDDPYSNEEGYDIERRAAGGDWAPLASVGAGVAQFADSGLAPQTVWTYRVRARLAGQWAGWSNESSATTWKQGDLNGDGSIDLTDLMIFQNHFGQASATWKDGDLNGDGVVNRADLSILLGRLGT